MHLTSPQGFRQNFPSLGNFFIIQLPYLAHTVDENRRVVTPISTELSGYPNIRDISKAGLAHNPIQNKEDIEPPARGLAQGAKYAK